MVLLLLAMFPANVHAAREGLNIGGTPVTPLVPRTLLQVLFLGATVAAAFGSSRNRATAQIGQSAATLI
jgi:uncharacterized membrane protein